MKRKKLSIAILTEVLNTYSGSRAPIELAYAINRLNPKQLDLCLISFSYKLDNTLQKDLESKNIKVFTLKVTSLSFLSKFKASFKLFEIFKKNSIDIILFHGSLPMFLIAGVLKKPIITTYYGTQFNAFEEKFLPNEKISLFQKLTNLSANLLIYIFQAIPVLLSTKVVAMTKYGSRECYKLFRRKVSFIYLGADSETLKSHQSTVIKKIIKNKNQITFISVSRITPYKGFHLLIEAFNNFEKQTNIKTRLLIVGSALKTNYLNYLKKIAGQNVKFLINISNTRLNQIYSYADIYLGADRYLFFGLPPLEAARFGIPSILMDYCSAREIVQNDKTGFVIVSKDEMIEKMILLASNSRVRQKMGQKAFERTMNVFSWEKTAKRYAIVMLNIIGKDAQE